MASNAETTVHRLWQEQDREEPMPLSEIRMKAERLTGNARRWNAVTAGVIVLMVIAETWQVWSHPELLERVGDTLTIAALLYVAYRYRRRHRVAPLTLGSTTCAAFYRAELVRQRDLARDSWGYLLPFVPGVTLSLLGGPLQERPASHVILLAAFGTALFAGVAWLNAYTARKRQREIDALDGS